MAFREGCFELLFHGPVPVLVVCSFLTGSASVLAGMCSTAISWASCRGGKVERVGPFLKSASSDIYFSREGFDLQDSSTLGFSAFDMADTWVIISDGGCAIVAFMEPNSSHCAFHRSVLGASALSSPASCSFLPSTRRVRYTFAVCP